MKVKTKSFIVLGLAIVLLAASVTFALAETGGQIRACVYKDGTLYLLTSETATCKSNTTLMTWNIIGPQGPVGPQGPKGDTGPQGPAGPASLAALEGTPCGDDLTGKLYSHIEPTTQEIKFFCYNNPVTLTIYFGSDTSDMNVRGTYQYQEKTVGKYSFNAVPGSIYKLIVESGTYFPDITLDHASNGATIECPGGETINETGISSSCPAFTITKNAYMDITGW